MARYSSREQGTGGWTYLAPAGHLCFPPKVYPENAGPGSKWTCPVRDCDRVWVASGMMVIGEYPVNMPRTDSCIGPTYWCCVEGKFASDEERALYDFDPTIAVRIA